MVTLISICLYFILETCLDRIKRLMGRGKLGLIGRALIVATLNLSHPYLEATSEAAASAVTHLLHDLDVAREAAAHEYRVFMGVEVEDEEARE